MPKRLSQLLVAFCLTVLCLAPAAAELEACVVCSTEQGRIHKEECSFSQEYDGSTYYFCQSRCRETFQEDPKSWSGKYQALLASQADKQDIAEGDALPRFRLPLEPVGSISTEDLLGKVVLINGWAGWCGPCMEEMPELVRLQKELQDQGLVILGLSFDKSREEHRKQIARLGLNFTSIYADQPEVQEFLKSMGTFDAIPFTLIVDQEGKLVKRLNQAATYEQFKEIVEPLLQGEDEEKEEANTGSVVPS